MTNEEIRDFTKQSGLELYGLGQDRSKWEASLTRFAELVAAKEREACAKICESMSWPRSVDYYYVKDDTADECAAAIRARENENDQPRITRTGCEGRWDKDISYQHEKINGKTNFHWNPLTDDGDAFRLAVKLSVSIVPYPMDIQGDKHYVIAKIQRKTDTLRDKAPTEVIELCGSDPVAATRRAIVKAAAEIGRNLK